MKTVTRRTAVLRQGCATLAVTGWFWYDVSASGVQNSAWENALAAFVFLVFTWFGLWYLPLLAGWVEFAARVLDGVARLLECVCLWFGMGTAADSNLTGCRPLTPS